VIYFCSEPLENIPLVFIPLSQGELSACLAGLVLNEVGNQIGPHSDVGPSVAAHLVVVRR